MWCKIVLEVNKFGKCWFTGFFSPGLLRSFCMIRALWIFKRKRMWQMCTSFNSSGLLHNWYFLPTFIIQLFEDCCMKHWFDYKEEQIHPGTGDKSELRLLFNYSSVSSPPKGINILCPTLLEVLVLSHSLYLFIASDSGQLLPHLIAITYFWLSLYFQIWF